MRIIKISISGEALKEVEKLKEITSRSSKGVFKKALEIYKFIVFERSKGSEIIIKNINGDRRLLIVD